MCFQSFYYKKNILLHVIVKHFFRYMLKFKRLGPKFIKNSFYLLILMIAKTKFR